MDKKNFALYDAQGNPTKQWYVWIKADGVRQRWSGDINRGQPDAAEKRRRAELLIEQLCTGEELPVSSKVSEKTAPPAEIKKLLAVLDNHQHRLRPRTYLVFKYKLQHMGRWLRQMRKPCFTRELAEQFVFELGKTLHETTVKEYINTALWAYKRADIRCPFAKVQKPRNQKTPAQYFSAYQRGKIKAVAETNALLWRGIQLLYYCFIRPNEQRFLQVSDVLVAEQKILIRGDHSKNKKTQYVVIPDAFLPVVESWELYRYPGDYYVLGTDGVPGPEPIRKDALGDAHLRVLQQQGFDTSRYKLYSWKHTGAVDFVKNNGSVKELQLQMRHHSLDQTDAYLRQLGVMDMHTIKSRIQAL
jgi:integrase